MNVADQRKSKRFELRLPFELVREGSQAMRELSETMNMSSVGVLFTSNVELEVGSAIEYIITLQSKAGGKESVRLHCMGKVVRREQEELVEEAPELLTVAATLERYEFVRPSTN
jgi:hypothetical protein